MQSMFAFVAILPAFAAIAADKSGAPFMAMFRANSADNTYAVGAKATVEASIADINGKPVTTGVVEVWADDGWTNVLWREKLDLDAFLGMTRAVEWLSKEPYADASRFVYNGVSQGGGAGMALTALWGKFRKSAIWCPSNCDMFAYMHGRTPGAGHVMDLTDEHRPAGERIGAYLDSCNFARMIKTPVRMAEGTRDDNCQTVGVIAAFNSIASEDKSLVILPGLKHPVWNTDEPSIVEWLFTE